MIDNKSVLALILARGGSKGLPRKNITQVAGKPMIAWTIEAARQSNYIDRIVLSSDDSEIIHTAEQYQCEVPFVRPSELARDDSLAIDAVTHALRNLPKFDILILLQPTCPLRDETDIDNAIRLMISQKANSCVSVSIPEKSPYWMFITNKKGRLRPLLNPELSNKQRQDLPSVYVLNGAIYVINIDHLDRHHDLVTPDTIPYVMSKEHSVDVDYELDLKIAELLLLQHLSRMKNKYSAI